MFFYHDHHHHHHYQVHVHPPPAGKYWYQWWWSPSTTVHCDTFNHSLSLNLRHFTVCGFTLCFTLCVSIASDTSLTQLYRFIRCAVLSHCEMCITVSVYQWMSHITVSTVVSQNTSPVLYCCCSCTCVPHRHYQWCRWHCERSVRWSWSSSMRTLCNSCDTPQMSSRVSSHV